MVGSVHFDDFPLLDRPICANSRHPGRATVGPEPGNRRRAVVCAARGTNQPVHRTDKDVGRIDSLPSHRTFDWSPGTYPLAANGGAGTIHVPPTSRPRGDSVRSGSAPLHSTSDCSFHTYPLASTHRDSQSRAVPRASPQQKRRVSRETRRPFPPRDRSLKPSSSPTRGRFRSRAGSVQARQPALPAQTRPSPAHNRSPRSATQRGRSVRSTASRRPCHAAR